VVRLSEETARERQTRVVKAGGKWEDYVKLASQKFELPKCSGCGKHLLAVYENEYWTYNFDERTGTYKGNLADSEILCPDCHARLRDEFKEGACNYQAEISNKSK